MLLIRHMSICLYAIGLYIIFLLFPGMPMYLFTLSVKGSAWMLG
uniref:Uncharacterized protein n=1 Tax=Arundo donax TaxID=35708 RepID=A0A0A9DQ01_ARUDO